MASQIPGLEDLQMQVDHGQIPLSEHPWAPFSDSDPWAPIPGSDIPITRTSSPNTSKGPLSSPAFASDEAFEQVTARRERQNASGRANRGRGLTTPIRTSPSGIEKKKSSKWKTKVTDARLSSELDRLLVGDNTSATSSAQNRAIHLIQHPLRAVIHSLPGFTFDTELDSVKFRKHQRVVHGVEGLMEGGMDAAKEWLEGFLILTFDTMAKVLERYPMYKDLNDVPLGFTTMAEDLKTAINKMPEDPALKPRRSMEIRLCKSYDLRKLVEWTTKARRRFLESKPKIVPGFGAYGQVSLEEGSDLEKRLWAAVDARGTT